MATRLFGSMRLRWIFSLCLLSVLEAVPLLMSWTTSLKMLDPLELGNVSILSSTGFSIAVDYHYRRGEVYYSDGRGRIYRAWFRGENVHKDHVIIAETILVDGLAVDWIHNNLYWTDTKDKTLEVSTLDGLDRRTLFDSNDGLSSPRAIVLHPSEGLLFWSDWGEKPSVNSAGLDGKDKKIISNTVIWPNGLALDMERKILYILEAKLGRLMSTNYNGSALTVILTSNSMIPAFGLTYYANNLYWTSWAEKSLLTIDLKSTPPSEKKIHDRSMVLSLGERMMGLKAVDSSLQPVTQEANPCSNKRCSHNCLKGQYGTSSCTCPFGFILSDDDKTCIEQGYILISWRKYIRRYLLEEAKLRQQFLTDLPDSAIAIDYHWKKGLVFWSDVNTHRIYRAPLEQLNNRTIVSTAMTCDGLVVDWIHDVLYWTDTEHNTLEAASLDGSHHTVLVSGNMDEPRALTLDPFNGLLFWTDWGVHPRIERANLDISDLQTIINTNIEWPNGITLDLDDKTLYWVDGKKVTLESCLYDGSQRKTLVGSVSSQPFGISLFKDSLFWTDWGQKSMFRTFKSPSVTKQLLNSSLLTPNGIKVVHSSLQRDDGKGNPCARLNCKSLCLGSPASPRKARCMGEDSSLADVSTNSPSLSHQPLVNILDTLNTVVSNDSFALSLSGDKMPSFAHLTVTCEKREGCVEDSRCSNNTKRLMFDHGGSLFVVTGLLPATKYKVDFKTTHNAREFHLTTKNNDLPELPNIRSVNVTDTAVTLSWDRVDTCVPDFESYNYDIYKAESNEFISTGKTNLTELTVGGLEPDFKYTMRLYNSKISHQVSTTFQTLSNLKNVVVYKKTRTEVYFRCDVSNRTDQNLLRFTGTYVVDGIQNQFDADATRCEIWPHSYCFHISSLNYNKLYSFNISAVLKSGKVGYPSTTTLYTQEGVSGPPENLRLVSYSPRDVEIQWHYPNQSNGILRNFIISIHETSTFNQEHCCSSFPLIEIPVEKDQSIYSYKPAGLTPASSYAISVTAKTVYVGGSEHIDVHTAPPPMDIMKTALISLASTTPLSWIHSKGSRLYTAAYQSLIKFYLLLLFAQNHHQLPSQQVSFSEMGPLHPLLTSRIGPGFIVIWNKNADDVAANNTPISVTGLTSQRQYKLAWVQVSQYEDSYGVDYQLSYPFISL